MTITRRAVPRCSRLTFASDSPASSAITWPPVKAAMSPRCWIRRWPKPGARAATASIVLCWLLATSIPSAPPVMSSARISSGRGSFITASSVGSRSFGCLIGLLVIRISGLSKTVSIRCVSRTMYGETQPFSITTPSAYSTVMPGVSDSSSVTTPSGPTRSIASATAAPITSSSLAAIVATWRTASPSTGRAIRRSSAERTSIASSMPRLRSIGFAPSSSACMPSRTIAWASSVAVVVPSPVRSEVLFATSRTSWAPMLRYWSLSSISRAIDTPSLVIVGGPASRSSTTLRPFGPSVTLTVLASASTPSCSRRRASWLK